jgi:hypothetical protein
VFWRSPRKTRWYTEFAANYRRWNAPEYRFYWRPNNPIEPDHPPQATDASLPYTTDPTFGDGVWYFALSYSNGVLDSGFLPIGPNGEPYIRIEISGGVATASPPRSPFWARLVTEASGVVRILSYYAESATNRADEWAITYTTNGSDPGEGSPDATVAMTGGGVQVLSYALPGQSDGTTVKVRVQTRRNDGISESPVWVYSIDDVIQTITADADGPPAVLGPDYFRTQDSGIES